MLNAFELCSSSADVQLEIQYTDTSFIADSGTALSAANSETTLTGAGLGTTSSMAGS